MPTHTVVNQVPPLENYDSVGLDIALREGLIREGAGWAEPELASFGRSLTSPQAIAEGVLANEYLPVLRSFDRYGHRIDQVEFHPSWHHLMKRSVEAGLHASPWFDSQPGAHAFRAAKFYLDSQNELGHACPISMTYSAIPALQHEPKLAELWGPKLAAKSYDPRFLPMEQKTGALCGMAMTEKQGGSDVRANTSRALENGDGSWSITGHKWFCSAPMCDIFLMLAQTNEGLTCFMVPRWLPDGTLNSIRIMRLKNKLGNKSNASSEIELDNTQGWRVGQSGRGVATILDMATSTRLDCVIGSTSMMRQALVQAIHHARHRQAFGRSLIAQPAMQNVLADLSIESEAATSFMLRLAAAYDRQDEDSIAFRRIATPIGKYFICKRAIGQIAESLECLGGNGYTEDFPLARLFRESPLNSVWEGSGNIMALDVLRAVHRTPHSLDVLWRELKAAAGEPIYDRFIEQLEQLVHLAKADEVLARPLVDHLARALQASLLIRFSTPEVAHAYLVSRLGAGGLTYGTLSAAVDRHAILARAWVE